MTGGIRNAPERPTPPDRTGIEEAAGNGDPDHAWKALNLVNDWVKHAETKSAATLAAAGVTGGVLYNLVKDQTNPSLPLDVVAAVCGAATVWAALAALAALAPQLTVPHRRRRQTGPADGGIEPVDEQTKQDAAQAAAEDDPVNLLFFADIAKHYSDDGPTYAQVLATLTANRPHLTRHIARQVHANALVTHRKFMLANRAIEGLRIALVFLALTAVVVAQH
jgi:hypothetical protein